MERLERWLRQHGLSIHDEPSGRLCVVTWGDADVPVLARDLRRHGIRQPPPVLRRWIDLKRAFRAHYRREPVGGLQACVESLGIPFVGRAHSGLVDSENTAKVVLHMARTGWRFCRATRGIGPDGAAWGAKSSRERSKRARDESSAKEEQRKSR